jgi:hypothetical protein
MISYLLFRIEWIIESNWKNLLIIGLDLVEGVSILSDCLSCQFQQMK